MRVKQLAEVGLEPAQLVNDGTSMCQRRRNAEQSSTEHVSMRRVQHCRANEQCIPEAACRKVELELHNWSTVGRQV